MHTVFSKKVLCLGNNTSDTDQLVQQQALKNQTINYGLVSDEAFVPAHPGFYHTTVIDVSSGGIVKLVKHFDSVIMLDQPAESWGHWKPLLTTFRLMQQLEEEGNQTVYRENENVQKFLKFDSFLAENKSFCIYPWILKIERFGHLTPCARSDGYVSTLDKVKDWATDPAYTKIREKMLRGEKLPDLCEVCYTHESRGVESYRVFETREWMTKLGIATLDDLKKITHPHYYEVRLSNKCNIACRGCRPAYSSRIEKEYKVHNIVYPTKQSWNYSTLEIIDKDTLDPDVRVYLTGGEPTVMRDVYKFMEDCITLGKTDFDFTLGTNAVLLSKKFLTLADHFSNLHFSISLDGYGKINDYWRWGSDWDTVIANVKELEARGHDISINCVPGIYNVTNLHLLMEFMDREFPFAGLYLQLNYNRWHSSFNHPNAKLVVESMKRCRDTRSYYINGKSVRSTIDALHEHYSKNPKCDLDALKDFFAYNDQQDQARNVKLADYIPELEECRKLL